MKSTSITSITSIVPYAAVIGAVVIGWQILLQPVSERAPPSLALRVSPGSPLVLSRAAESEYAGGRLDNASLLARTALAKAPFDVRAMRVFGLTEARAGRPDTADQSLTLAGNWSLRDDPSHAWLVERRLRQGDYGSAFGHADTLARRRPGSSETVFNFFTTAALQDGRALPSLVGLLAKSPPWRSDYLTYLEERQDSAPLSLALAVALQSGSAPFTDDELSALYSKWFSQGRFQAARVLRTQIDRPNADQIVVNGDFSTDEARQIAPFGWTLRSVAGISSTFESDDVEAGNRGLRVDYDGYATDTVLTQTVMLPPGPHRLSGRQRLEAGAGNATLRWLVTCVETGTVISSIPLGEQQPTGKWSAFSNSFVVPQSDCTAQRLSLESVAQDRRDPTVFWFDDIQASALQSSSARQQ